MVAGDRLSDWISLGVLASWVPRDAVEVTGKSAKQKGGKAPAAGQPNRGGIVPPGRPTRASYCPGWRSRCRSYCFATSARDLGRKVAAMRTPGVSLR
jgi:hypothetical protein